MGFETDCFTKKCIKGNKRVDKKWSNLIDNTDDDIFYCKKSHLGLVCFKIMNEWMFYILSYDIEKLALNNGVFIFFLGDTLMLSDAFEQMLTEQSDGDVLLKRLKYRTSALLWRP